MGSQTDSSPLDGSALGGSLEYKDLNDCNVAVRGVLLNRDADSFRDNFHPELRCMGGFRFVVVECCLSFTEINSSLRKRTSCD